MHTEPLRQPVDIGSMLGPYRIDALIGQGGMGVVYRALDTKLNRPVAVKFLSPEVANEKARRRFQREAQLASSLNHPHILTVHDAGDWNGQQYVVTEFVDGGTLASWAAESPRSWRQCVELLTGVAEGLAAAHEAHILHRDIKPGNILVSRNGYAKLADFGLARLEGNAATDETRTQSGAIVGTVAYMSPEQAMGRVCDARSDIFSLGVVLFEMLSGRRPFEGGSSLDVLQKIVHQAPTPLPNSILGSVRNLVEKALEKEPADRYQSVREMVVDLRRIGRRVESESAAGVPVADANVSRQRRWWIPGAAVLAIAILVFALAYRGKATVGSNPELEKFAIEPPPGGRFRAAMGPVGGFAVSPNGKAFAFLASAAGKNSLWIQSFDGSVLRTIEGIAIQRPFWSPDSKSVAFFDVGRIYRVGVSGGAPQPVAKLDSLNPMAGSWSEDETILFFDGGKGFFTVSATGGEPKPLPGSAGAFPQWLPGGGFLFFRSNGGKDPAIYVATTADPKGERLVSASGLVGYFSGYLLWRHGTALLAQPFDPKTLTLDGSPQEVLNPIGFGPLGDPHVSVSTTGRIIYDAAANIKQLAWYSGAQMVGPFGGSGIHSSFRLFDKGRRAMIQVEGEKEGGVWVVDERGTSSPVLSGTFAILPTPSPDDKTVLFGTGMGIARSSIGGEDRRVLNIRVEPTVSPAPTDWSGDVMLFHLFRSESSRLDIWSVRLTPDGDVAPGAEPKKYLETAAGEGYARFAPGQNQKWLAYHSDKSGHQEIYLNSYPARRQDLSISTQGGRFPVWDASGRKLFYTTLDDQVMVVDAKFSASSVSASPPRKVFSLSVVDSQPFASRIDTYDGERFLVLSSVASPTRPLQVIDNWTQLLKK